VAGRGVVHDTRARVAPGDVLRHERRGHEVVRVREHHERVARHVLGPEHQLVPHELAAESLQARSSRSRSGASTTKSGNIFYIFSFGSARGYVMS
jgi:hypothetical protein